VRYGASPRWILPLPYKALVPTPLENVVCSMISNSSMRMRIIAVIDYLNRLQEKSVLAEAFAHGATNESGALRITTAGPRHSKVTTIPRFRLRPVSNVCLIFYRRFEKYRHGGPGRIARRVECATS
jgi:hypothetical protein